MIHIQHEGGTIEAEDLGAVSVLDIQANDFVLDKYLGACHLVLRELSSDGRLITLWDCDGRGHTYALTESIRVARPVDLDDDARVWPDDEKVQEWLEEKAYLMHLDHDEDDEDDDDDDDYGDDANWDPGEPD